MAGCFNIRLRQLSKSGNRYLCRMDYLEQLQKRYSVKKFDGEKKVQQEILERIMEAGKLSASSLGLQPYEIIVVASDEMREKLIPAFYNPSQITSCSHLMVITAKNGIGDEYINNYFSHISDTRQIPLDNLELFRKSIDSHMNRLSPESLMSWAEKQGYIVLGNLMFAAALENVDTCPMEGFRQEVIDEILNLDPKKEKTCITLALGYRSAEDHFQNLKKVRKPNDKLFKFM